MKNLIFYFKKVLHFIVIIVIAGIFKLSIHPWDLTVL